MELNRRLKWDLAEVGVLLAACLLAVRGVWGKAPGLGVDASGTYWFYGWIQRSLVQGVDPSWTAQFYHPHGMDVVATTGFNFVDAYLSVPLQLLLGFPNYLTPWVAIILLGNALAMRALLRALGLSRIAVLAGALIMALHPYIIFEVNNGRLTQSLLWFWPLGLRELYLMRRDPRWRRPVLAGLFMALQAWTYWFSGHFLLLLSLPALILLARRVHRPWWKRLALAAGVCGVMVAPGAAIMLAKAGQGLVPGLVSVKGGMNIDIMALRSHAWWLFGQEGGIFQLALPTVFATALVLLLCRNPLLHGLTAALALLMAVGPMQQVFGASLSNPLWSGATALLPGFGRFLFPYRFWSVVVLICAVALAEVLDRWFRLPSLRAGAAAALVTLIVWPIHDNKGLVHGQDIPLPAYIQAVRRNPGPVLDLPFPCVEESIYQQLLHGQPLISGMGQRMEDYRPKGMIEAMTAHPMVAHAMAASRGISEESPTWPGGLRRPETRWLVLHLGFFRRSPQVRFCVDDFEGPPDMRLLLRARRIMEEAYGPPAVADEEAVAWDLWRLDPDALKGK